MPIRITPIANGPLKLDATSEPFPVLRGHPGGDEQPGKTVFLCRCGESANKPYCDGAHTASGYSSENRCDRDAVKDFAAPEITVHFNRAICSGAGECVRGLPSVFVSGAEDWIRPDQADVAEVIEVVRRCPSGALTYSLGGAPVKREEKEVTVRIVKDGPYEVTGPVELATGTWSANASRTCFALCRCGKSQNAPFCDYSHGELGWTDDA
jgi:CDGSH-type Zn-finger protein/ferredoxin